MKKPITTKEYFEIICNLLSEKGKMPENILDYKLSTSNAVFMKTYEFSLKNNLAYGGNEGIYLVLWIEVHVNREKQLYPLGTFKTLQENEEAMHMMANLLADFLIEEQTYVNEHLDDFTWEGADVHVLLEDGIVSSWGYTCSTMETAIKKKDTLLQSYSQVIIRDNATRKEKIYRRKGNEIE